MEMIEKYPDKPWDWRAISWNPNLTMEMIEKYPDKPWKWEEISSNRNLTMDFIEKYIDKKKFIIEYIIPKNQEIFENKLKKFNAFIIKVNLSRLSKNFSEFFNYIIYFIIFHS